MTDFTEKWEEVADLGFEAGRFRVMPDHPLDLFVAYSPDGNRQFMFQMPYRDNGVPDPPRLENILAETREIDGQPALVMTLVEGELRDLFSVICIDLTNASGTVSDPATAASIFMTRLDRWSDLLRRRRGGGMALPDRLGLLGELILIDHLLTNGKLPPGPLLRGWRGPDGDSTDLAVNGLRFEVKAQLATAAPRLRISSLDQLESTDESLILVWHRFSRADQATTLGLLVDSIAQRLSSTHRDLLEFQRKLLLSGYDPAADYVDESFSLDQRVAYRVTDDFPKLVHTNVPEGVISAQYDISCGHLTDFEIRNTDFEDLIRG